jgi:hypothetical protein
MPSFPVLPESEGFLFSGSLWSRGSNTGPVPVRTERPEEMQTPFVALARFSTHPLTRGWQLFGDPQLFLWNAEQQNLQVTWNSSRSNSFLALPLGLTLNRHLDFTVSLDLLLEEVTPASTPGKPGAMQVAFGFQNQSDAQKPAFNRGTGMDSPNLVEFNYFPDTGFGATVMAAATTTNSNINYNGPEDFGFYELPLGVNLRVTLDFNSTNETISLAIRTNGTLIAPITSARLSTNSSAFSQPFTDFQVDAFAISSYTDIGVEGEFAGSLHARGTIDNIDLRVPHPPVSELQLQIGEAGVNVSFVSTAGWRYTVETTSDFHAWTPLGEELTGTGERLSITQPLNPAARHAFYRVSARRN